MDIIQEVVNEERQLEAQSTMRTTAKSWKSQVKKFSNLECILHFCLLIVFLAISVMARGHSDWTYTQTTSLRRPMVTDLFRPWSHPGSEKTFEDITTVADIYQFITTVAIKLLIPENWNTNRDSNMTYVQTQQLLLGGIRLRQVRKKAIACEKSQFDAKKTSAHYCYDESEEETTSELTFGAMTFKYNTASELKDQSWRGKYGSYAGSGYYVDLPLNAQNATQIVTALEAAEWIDSATRFVSMDFNTYNPSTTLHTVVRIGWEMPSGVIFSNDEFKTWKFDRYLGSQGITLLVFHILFLLILAVMTVMMAVQMIQQKCWKCKLNYEKIHTKRKNRELNHLTVAEKDTDLHTSYWQITRWRYLDVVNLLFFYISIGIFAYNERYQLPRTDIYSVDTFVSFRSLQYTFTLESMISAMNAWLLIIKVFKYLILVGADVNKNPVNFFFLIFRRAAMDIVTFMIVLLVFFLSFGTAAFLVFNSDVADFRSYSFSLINMCRYTVTEMDYPSLTASSGMFGSLFYFSWTLMMILVLVNIFIAILNEAFAEVKTDLDELNAELDEHGNKIQKRFHFGMFGMGMKKAVASLKLNLATMLDSANADGDGDADNAKQVAEIQMQQFDKDNDGVLSVEEFCEQAQCTEVVAQFFFTKYDTDQSGFLSADEYEAALRDLNRSRAMGSAEDGDEEQEVHKLLLKDVAPITNMTLGNIGIDEWNEVKEMLDESRALLLEVDKRYRNSQRY